MKLPIWLNGFLRDWKHPFMLPNRYPDPRLEWFPSHYYTFSTTKGLVKWCRGYSMDNNTYFLFPDLKQLQLEDLTNEHIEDTVGRYTRPTYSEYQEKIASLEGDIETDTIDALAWLQPTKVVLPKYPPCCLNCEYGDCGNHHDEPAFCGLLEQCVGHDYGLIVCPLWKPSWNYRRQEGGESECGIS